MTKKFLFAIGLGLSWFINVPASAAQPQDMVQQGAYLARLADCIACHTAPGGKPFAGGLKMETPIGAVYSSNITPDKKYGIGSYSYQDFEKAVRHGVTPAGVTLYPAMPYPSYARVSDDDIRALYAYFMQGVAPVAQESKPVDIPWPLSMRWPLMVWRKVFVADYNAPTSSPTTDKLMLRGAYLAEGLGHCGACHTPRSVTMNEKALSNTDPLFLSGGAPIDGWIATNLRGDYHDGLGSWSSDDIVNFLRTGRNTKTAAFGGMADVISNSTQHWSDKDLLALATYLKSLQPTKPATQPLRYDPTVTNELRVGDIKRTGAQIYLNRCAGCHRSDGQGYDRVFPALALNPVMHTDDATSLIHIVLSGAQVPATVKAPSSFAMPGFAGTMSDQEVADVVNFVRSSWGNDAKKINAADVGRVRKKMTLSHAQ